MGGSWKRRFLGFCCPKMPCVFGLSVVVLVVDCAVEVGLR